MSQFLKELSRRNVIRVAIAYAVVAWLLIEVTATTFPVLKLPDWSVTLLTALILIGFPLALIFAWAFEITPEGVKLEKHVDQAKSIARHTGRKLDFGIIGFLAIALAYFMFTHNWSDDREETGDIKSIAVLPFANRSAAEENAEFFAAGVHDDLLTLLTKVGDLRVISRTSVERLDPGKSIREIGEELGVATVLEGGVQRAGDQVRINVQLIDARTDDHLWAEIYNRELTVGNVLDIQSEIARAIASALQAALSPEENRRLDRYLTDDLEAYDAYLRAKYVERFHRSAGREEALASLEFALERDPGFAAAWALYARILLGVYWYTDPDPELLERARAAIERGRSLDPDIYELDIADGYYYYWGFRDYDRARAALDRALEVAPGDADLVSLLAFINRRDGSFEASLGGLRQVLELDPGNIIVDLEMADIYTFVYDWEAAQKMVDRALVVNPTSIPGQSVRAQLLIERWGVSDVLYAHYLWWIEVIRENYEAALEHVDFGEFTETKFGLQPPGLLRGLTYLYAGDEETARRELEIVRADVEEMREEASEDGRVYRALCLVYGALRLQDEAREACRLGMEYTTWDAFETGFLRVEVAKGLALAGLTDEALDMIELYLSEPSGYGSGRTELEPAFRGLRDEPRFQKLVEHFRNRKLQELSFE